MADVGGDADNVSVGNKQFRLEVKHAVGFILLIRLNAVASILVMHTLGN